jgi:hypothetical protein
MIFEGSFKPQRRQIGDTNMAGKPEKTADKYRLYCKFTDAVYDSLSNDLPSELGITDEQFENIWSNISSLIDEFYKAITAE